MLDHANCSLLMAYGRIRSQNEANDQASSTSMLGGIDGVSNLGSMLGFTTGSARSRRRKMVTFLTRGLGDGAKWYEYEIFDDGLSISVTHSSGEKWTRFLESFLGQCCRIANVDAQIYTQGQKSLKVVFTPENPLSI